MDEQLARRLEEMTNAFYREVSTSFSATRQAPWPGWERVLEECGIDGATRLTVLDLACGNLRFERFLSARIEGLSVWAVDNCDELVEDAGGVDAHFQHLDIARNPQKVVAPPCDVAVCFGFMHHLPLVEQRRAVLRTMIEHVRPGGCAAVSFWQFMRDSRISAKARPVEGGDAGDYLLGWQDRTDVARYCHSFEEDEVDLLAAQMSPLAREVARFSADGRTGDLNRYLILQRVQ